MTEPIPTASELLRAFKQRARKSLGQHFLVDGNIISKIAAQAVVGDEPVLEVGPGPGALTQALARRSPEILAVEKDRRAVAHLQQTLVPACAANDVTLKVIEGDILQFPLPESEGRWAVTGNLPYNIATQVFFHFLPERHRISRMVFMFQREVAQRFVATPSTSAYGVLSLVGQLFFDMELLFHVSPGSFRPIPGVTSSVLRFIPRTDRPEVDETRYRQVVKKAFNQRRKTLPNSLKGIFGLKKPVIREVIVGLGLDARARAEELDVPTFCQLVRGLEKAAQ